MVALPTQTPTIDAIYQSYVDREAEIPVRTYLGGSEIGTECRRALFYSFRHIRRVEFSSRILRLFQTGVHEEARIIADLRAAGCEVLDKDPATNEQWEFKACDDHLQTHLDGVVLGLLESPATYHLLEVKSSNQKYHNQLVKHGVQKAKPVHYSQMQIGMGLAGLKRAAYISVCKNDDSIHYERIHYDATVYKALLAKANAIIKAESPPDRIGKDPSFWLCRFCDYSSFCWGKEFPNVSCRSCAHSSPVADGEWDCEMNYITDPPACQEHLFIPGLLHWAEPIDGDPTWVRYRADGYEFINCAATGFPGADVDHYSSRELRDGKEPEEIADDVDPVHAMYGPPPVEMDYGPPAAWPDDDDIPF